MHIFIDESGNFIVQEQQQSKFCNITSLTIPDKYLDNVIKKFVSMKKDWGYDKEIKGSKLNEKQISDVIALLRSFDCLVEIVCLDVVHQSVDKINAFKELQANRLLNNLTSEHHETLIKNVYDLKEQLLKLPNQLFIQLILSITLIRKVLNHSTFYFSQRLPEELGNFIWYIDAKNNNTAITPFEKLWTTLLLPILQTNYKMEMLIEGDYRFFKKYDVYFDDLDESYKKFLKEGGFQAKSGADLKKLISEQLYFKDSKDHIGLQLVDIISNSFSRAMNGNLKYKGWRHIGALMVKKPSVFIFDSNKNSNPEINVNHNYIFGEIKSKLKLMFTKEVYLRMIERGKLEKSNSIKRLQIT